MLIDKGEIIVNFVGRFENLHEDFNRVCDMIKVKRNKLKHVNDLSDRPHYSFYYNLDSRNYVAEIFKWYIEVFGYTFDDSFLEDALEKGCVLNNKVVCKRGRLNKYMKLGLITRCRNEPYVNEFVNHYINEGIDNLYIIDDHSRDDLYKDISHLSMVQIVTDIFFENGPEINILYNRIREDFDWIVIVDMDEYITTRRNSQNTLKEELLTTFKDADCIKIPWVMMAFNGIDQNPECLLETNIYRMDQDKKHHSLSRNKKFRCRYKEIEVKCAFKTKVFYRCWHHGPEKDDVKNVRIVDAVYNRAVKLDPFYQKLREKDISQAFLLCFHCRTVSRQQCADKLDDTHLKRYQYIDINDLILFDFPEKIDNTLSLKSQKRPNIFTM